MFVIVDMEWITNSVGHQSPTQLAAARVDDEWNTIDEYSAFIRPRDRKFCDGEHIAYTGGSISDFVYARGAYDVLTDFENWLNEDDILLWWQNESEKLFEKLVSIILKVPESHKSVSIARHVFAHLDGRAVSRGNPYKLAKANGVLVRENLKHYSKNDVRVIRELMLKISYPQETLLKPVVKQSKKEKNAVKYPYRYDPLTNLIHIVGCKHIEGVEILGYETMKIAFRKGFEPCDCCKEEYKKAFKERTIDIISRTQYTYIYSPDSNVFHKYTCGLMHSAKYVMGACKYDKLLATGRRPCKVCNPTPYDVAKVLPPKHKDLETVSNKNLCNPPLPSLPKDVVKAIGRQKLAAEERAQKLQKENLSVTEINDIFTLTQPRFAFWAGKGHSNFHLHSCPKLKNVTELSGFGSYQEAVRAGYRPCKKCKPATKHNVELSIPITNRVRENEQIEDLEALCEDAGYAYKREERYFYLNTEAGKWKVNTEFVPLRLEHINLITSPFETEYHEQPRLFLSFVDLFSYIKRHDENLMKQEAVCL